jgi:hypothetical protein
MQLEAKQATNHVLYNSIAPEIRPDNPDQYLIRGVYFFRISDMRSITKTSVLSSFPAGTNIWIPTSEWHPIQDRPLPQCSGWNS